MRVGVDHARGRRAAAQRVQQRRDQLGLVHDVSARQHIPGPGGCGRGHISCGGPRELQRARRAATAIAAWWVGLDVGVQVGHGRRLLCQQYLAPHVRRRNAQQPAARAHLEEPLPAVRCLAGRQLGSQPLRHQVAGLPDAAARADDGGVLLDGQVVAAHSKHDMRGVGELKEGGGAVLVGRHHLIVPKAPGRGRVARLGLLGRLPARL
eukprot:scaffold37267_cov66-Phaeocystis_antarctica.AAC.3